MTIERSELKRLDEARAEYVAAQENYEATPGAPFDLAHMTVTPNEEAAYKRLADAREELRCAATDLARMLARG